MREVGVIYLGDVQYQRTEAPAVSLDDSEEGTIWGLWAVMVEDEPILKTLHLLIRSPLLHNRDLIF